MTPDPKPARRIIDPDAGKSRLEAGEGCPLCAEMTMSEIQEMAERGYIPLPFARSRHHLIKRSQGGDDLEANIAIVCGHGTCGHHGALEARVPAALAAMRRALTMAQLDYIVGKVGVDRLDRLYPFRRR